MGLFSAIGSAFKALSPVLGPVGTALSIAGTAKGLLSKDKNQANYLATQQAVSSNDIYWRAKAAKKAGLHPLFALGAPTIGAPAIVGQSDHGSKLRDLGEQIGRIGDSTKRLERKLLEAQITESRARALREQAAANKDYIAAMKIAADAAVLDHQGRANPDYQAHAFRNGIPKKYIDVWNENTQRVEKVPNPDIYEIPEIVGGAMYGGSWLMDMQKKPRSRGGMGHGSVSRGRSRNPFKSSPRRSRGQMGRRR